MHYETIHTTTRTVLDPTAGIAVTDVLGRHQPEVCWAHYQQRLSVLCGHMAHLLVPGPASINHDTDRKHMKGEIMNCRKIKCGDRLPDVGYEYNTDLGLLYLNIGNKWIRESGGGINRTFAKPEWWLEPYELPTKGEIRGIIKVELTKVSKTYGYIPAKETEDALFVAITNLLKDGKETKEKA